jgi:hypothetical protein
MFARLIAAFVELHTYVATICLRLKIIVVFKVLLNTNFRHLQTLVINYGAEFYDETLRKILR